MYMNKPIKYKGKVGIEVFKQFLVQETLNL